VTLAELERLATDRFMARAAAIAAVLADPAKVTRVGRVIWHTEVGKAALDEIHRTMPAGEAVCGRVSVRAISPRNITAIRRHHPRFQYRLDGKLVKRSAVVSAL
jgi:hypothetical protein